MFAAMSGRWQSCKCSGHRSFGYRRRCSRPHAAEIASQVAILGVLNQQIDQLRVVVGDHSWPSLGR